MLTGFLRTILAALLLVQLPASNAQNVEPFKFFRDYVGLKEDQIAAIQNGKARPNMEIDHPSEAGNLRHRRESPCRSELHLNHRGLTLAELPFFRESLG